MNTTIIPNPLENTDQFVDWLLDNPVFVDAIKRCNLDAILITEQAAINQIKARLQEKFPQSPGQRNQKRNGQAGQF